MAIDEQLAEGSVAEDGPIGPQALRQNLSTVRNEQQAGILQALAELTIVERRHQRLAGAGGCHDEVPVAVMPLALGVEALEHLTLERPRLQVEMENRGGLGHRCRANGAIEPVGVPGGIVRLVAGIGPVALERGLELLDQVRRRRLRQTNVPLNAVQHGAVRQIGRSDDMPSSTRTVARTATPSRAASSSSCRTRL